MGNVLRGFELTDNDRSLLDRIQQSLPLLADLARADVVLFCASQSADAVDVFADAKPRSVSAVCAESLSGKKVTKEEDPELYQALCDGKARRVVRHESSGATPSVREMNPISNNGRVIGVLCLEAGFMDRAQRSKRDPVFRSAIAQLRRMILDGELEGAKNIGPLGPHDGPLVVDTDGRIVYTSAIADSLYRSVGCDRGLLDNKITELGTDETAFSWALETGVCAERLVSEGDLVLVKKAIPLIAAQRDSWWGKLLRRPREIDGVLLVVHDITEERRREQELRLEATMIQEVHHRVKNNLQTIAALLRLQARRTSSQEVADMLRQSINRILSVATVHEFLSLDEASVINIKEVCQRIVDEVTQAVLDPEKRIRFVLDGDNIHLPAQQATSCALIVNELLQNAVEHGFGNRRSGIVAINLVDHGSTFTLEIADDGQGLPPGFNVAKTTNLGLQIVRTLVAEDLKGEFELINGVGDSVGVVKGGGVRAVVTIPRSQRSQRAILAVGR
ncbi:MAG: histidine kinase N-terminal domain-containing protein [Chloroflexi bacterium]|nr:histidine kinase N-terminal domain-containing protein [Chloroflexota bacterium]